MSFEHRKQSPISLRTSEKSDLRTQFAALCYRIVKDKPEILLVTSRRSGRWIIPKGWPIDGKTPAECVLIEAWEEAGVRGKITGGCMGLFSYQKAVGPERCLPCVAMIYPVKVKSLAGKYPECGQRRRKWIRPRKAAALVAEPDLSHILKNFDPRRLKL